jgi:carbonic anhydrase
MNFENARGNMTFKDINGVEKIFYLRNLSFKAPAEHTVEVVRYDVEM